MNRSVPMVLIVMMGLFGIIFFGVSFVGKIINDYNHKNYIETTATFIQSNYDHENDNGTKMYTLTYTYFVDANEYYYTTDYSTSVIPKRGSTIKVKYNPVSPGESYSSTFDSFSLFQLLGVCFLFFSLIILFSHLICMRDILIFVFTSYLLYVFIVNKFYMGAFIGVIVILGIFWFASIMELISYLIKNKRVVSNDGLVYMNTLKKTTIDKSVIEQELYLNREKMNLKK